MIAKYLTVSSCVNDAGLRYQLWHRPCTTVLTICAEVLEDLERHRIAELQEKT